MVLSPSQIARSTSRFFFSVSTATPWVLRVVFTASWAVENTSARPSVL